MKFDRPSLRPLATFALGLLVLVACQNATEPTTNSSDPVVVTATFQVAASRVPDSIVWKTPDASGSRKSHCSGSPAVTCSEVFQLPHPLGSDSLSLELWTLGIRTGTIFFGENGRSSTLDWKTTTILRDTLDTLLLHKYDSLPKSVRDSFSVFGSSSSGLVAYYARLILAADPSFTAKTLPVGMSQSSVNTDLVYWFRISGGSSNILVALKLDSTTAQKAISALISAKLLTPADSSVLFPPYPVRVLAGLSVGDSLTPGGKAVAVTGKFVWNKGTNVWPVVQIRTVNPADSVNLWFPTEKFLSPDTILDLSGNLTLQALSQALPGIDTLVLTLPDDAGHQAVSKTTFRVVSNAATPTIFPNGGAFFSTQTATVVATGSDSIQISTDSLSWTKYSSAISVSASERLYARSFKGGVTSPVTSATFAIGTVPVPSLTPNGGGFYGVDTVVVAAIGSDSIQVSTDSATWTRYSTKIVVNATGKLYARSFKGGVASSVTAAAFTSSAVPIPTIAPNGGTFYSTQSVAATAPAGTDSIQISTDSSTWTKYTKKITVSSSSKLYARSIAGGVASPVVSAIFTIGTVPVPSLSPNGGAFYGAQNVTISAAGTDSIQTTTDTSTASWTKYTSAMNLLASEKLYVRAFKGGVASNVTSAAFTIGTAAVPSISPSGGTFYSSQNVTVSATGADSVQTTTDTATVPWTKYTSALALSASEKLSVRAFKDGASSAVVSVTFIFKIPQVPRISPEGGAFTSSQLVDVSATGSDSIEVSADKVIWASYSPGLSVSTTRKLYARSFIGGTVSGIDSVSFVFPPTLTPSPVGGSYADSITAKASDPGADSIQWSANNSIWTTGTTHKFTTSGIFYARSWLGGITSPVSSVNLLVKHDTTLRSLKVANLTVGLGVTTMLNTDSLPGRTALVNVVAIANDICATVTINGDVSGIVPLIGDSAIVTIVVTNGNAALTYRLKLFGRHWSMFTDIRDGQSYSAVKIGTQWWMSQNLNYDTTGSFCYNGSADNCSQYGRLYGSAYLLGVCPSGWHIPSVDEWNLLSTTVGGSPVAGKMLKSPGWDGIDAYDFAAIPGGWSNEGHDSNLGGQAAFWTSVQSEGVYLTSGSDTLTINNWPFANALSIRCIGE